MSRTCTKCKNEITDDEELEPIPASYPCCTKCWDGWKENRVMVINELRLDMSSLKADKSFGAFWNNQKQLPF